MNGKLLPNKLYAILLILCTIPITFLDGDATATVFIAMIAVPMFFAKENWIYRKERKRYAKCPPKRRRPLAYSRQEEADCLQHDCYE